MELWIRSQDREKLVKINDKIYCEHSEEPLDEYGDVLYFYDISTDADILGTYSTEERALEVLDEIQNILVPDIKLLSKKINEDQEDDLSNLKTLFSVIQPDGELQIHQLHNVVYQMPQE